MLTISPTDHFEIKEILRKYPAVLSPDDREFLTGLLSYTELTTNQTERLNAITEELLIPPIVINSTTTTADASI